ncbi:MAG: YdbL family protein [Candidatus Omnitrophica bacterium]|nr:YdbL family protein [Candidatus Omnitrophota bacterium]
MRKLGLILLALVVFGCAKVSVETKNPIKVDINMRIDVYQHVAKDAESINDQIYGNKEKKFNALFNFAEAYASDLSADIQAIIDRRRARAQKVESYFNQGFIGENQNALLETRKGAPADAAELIAQENFDREAVYTYTATRNSVSISETRKVFLEDDYDRASSGWWFQVPENGQYIWKQK